MQPISLSPSKINLFNDCPRCFWDSYSPNAPTKNPRPRGIFPSLPGGMDLILKSYVDQFRGQMPPQLQGKVPGILWPDHRLHAWRNWRSGPTYVNTDHQIKVVGALDDMLLVNGNACAPLDWKTKGSEPKDDGSQYYQTQLDCYTLMGEFNGLEMTDFAYLVYTWPENVISDLLDGNSWNIQFGFKPFKLITSKERATEKIIKAAECLRGARPNPNPACEHCVYLENSNTLKHE